MRYKSLWLFMAFALIPGMLFASGKIRGKVIDKDTKESLVGANVSIEGTTMGASTDVNGEYTILNVPTGTYSVKGSFVGYQTTTVSNIRVNNDLTTSLDFDLANQAVAIGAIEIVAERPLVNKSATNAVRITTADDIASMPVRGVNNVLALSAGVVLQDNTVFIRGGRLDEVGYYLDGVSIKNPVTGGRAVTLVQDALEEIQVQAGGYTAEFGGANSGIIQQQLKTGTPDWKFSLQYSTDNLAFKGKSKNFDGQKTLGSYPFGYNEGTVTLSGPIMSEAVKFFGLFNYNFQRDANPQPYPGIDLGIVRDPVSGDSIDLTYPAGAVRGNSTQQYTGTGTMTIDLRPVTLRFSGTYTSGTAFAASNTARTAGNIANILNEGRIEKIKTTNGSGSLKFSHLLSPTTFYEITGGYFSQTQNLGDPILGDNFLGYGDSVANAQAGVIWTRRAGNPVGRYTRQANLAIFTFAFNAPGDVVAGYQKFKRENISLAGSFFTQLGNEHSIKFGGEYQRYTLRNYSFGNEGVFALPGLIAQNEAETDPAKKLTLAQIYINRGVNNYGYDVFGNSNTVDGFEGPRHPVFWAAYIQDKIEYKDLVVNIGFRYDYINTNNYALIDPTRPETAIRKADGAVDPAGLRKTSSFQSVSPRLGLSFPVSDRTVFHTQFGKFVQQSRLADIFQGLYATGSNIRGGFFINSPVGFDVRPERTTQYEIGFTQQIGDNASFDITGYYKDISNQVVYDQQASAAGSQYGSYFILRNGDFATTKGVELTLNMRRQKRLQVNAALSFQDARGTGSYPNSNRGIVGAPLDGVTVFAPQYISPLEYNNAVRGNLNLDYRFAKDDGGAFEQLGASILFSFNSGHPYTRGIGGPDLEGDARFRQPVEALGASTTPWIFQVDLRIDKTFRLFNSLDMNVALFVINVFDTKNVQNVFLRTGSTGDDGYISDPALGGTLVNTFGPRYAQVYKAINIDYYEQYQQAPGLSTTPLFFGPPRQVRIGAKLEI